MPLGPSGLGVVEEVEPVAKTFRERGGTDRTRTGCGEFDGEGQSVDAADDVGHGRRVVVTEREVGARGGGPFDEHPNRGDLRQVVDGHRARRHGERLHPSNVLARQTEHLPARGQDRQVGARREHPFGEVRHGQPQVFAVVEHEQCAPAPQVLDEGVLDAEVLALVHVDGRCHRCDRRQRVVDGRQLHHVHLSEAFVPHVASDPQRQARLSHTAGTDEGDEPVLAEVAHDASQVGAPPDERRGLGREATRAMARQRCRCGEQRRIGVEDPCLELADGDGRIEPQLLAQDGAERGDPAESIGRSSAPVQGDGQLVPGTLTKWMLRRRALRDRPRSCDPRRARAGPRAPPHGPPCATPRGATPRPSPTRDPRIPRTAGRRNR